MSDAPRKTRVGSLSTVGGVVSEQAKVYRECRKGGLDSEVAARLVRMLSEIRVGLEVGQLEARIAALEARK